jgi:hypothetical protein
MHLKWGQELTRTADELFHQSVTAELGGRKSAMVGMNLLATNSFWIQAARLHIGMIFVGATSDP